MTTATRQRLDQASRADRYDLYQRSVQAPAADVAFFERVFVEARGRTPVRLREDFAGTAYLSATWARSRGDRSAVALDLDPEPLDWGRRHNLSEPEVAARVELRHADVRTVVEPPVDLVCAPNFSICCLRERPDLITYLEAARASLVDDGLFVCELYGGTEAIIANSEERTLSGFDYTWEQESFNPIDNHLRCSIHFHFPDGSALEQAFRYDFRLWGLPELADAARDAGFAGVRVYWESVDTNGDGTGLYHRTTEEENQEGWLVYLVALR
jgi:hypothetical protein